MKKVKALVALVALVAMVAVSSVAFAQQQVTVGTQVRGDQSISALCWNFVGGGWNFQGDATVSLFQPGDRSSAAGNDSATDPNYLPTGTAFYNTLGGDPDAALFPAAEEAFGYGDCRVTLSNNSVDPWYISMHGTDFEDTVDGTYSISDMVGAETIGFDYLLENEANYSAIEEEHGFFINAHSAALAGHIQDDNGSAFGIDSYTAERPYNDKTCNTDRPCYHGIPAAAGGGHVLYNTGAVAQILDEDAFITRFGVGVDTLTEAVEYAMTVTYELTI